MSEYRYECESVAIMINTLFRRWKDSGRGINNRRLISESIRTLQQSNFYESKGNKKRVRSWGWSEKAFSLMTYNKAGTPLVDSKKVTVDHPVTVEHTIQKLWSEFEELSLKDIVEIVYNNSKTVVVTKEEDLEINSKGFKSKMPENYDESNFLIRYEGILDVLENPLNLKER